MNAKVKESSVPRHGINILKSMNTASVCSIKEEPCLMSSKANVFPVRSIGNRVRQEKSLSAR